MSTVVFYIIPAILCIFGFLQYDCNISHHRKSTWLWIIIYLYLVLLMGLRFEVGGDTLSYMGWFPWAKDTENWKLIDPMSPYEPGFTLIAAFVKTFGGEFYHLQLIHAIILNTGVFYFISKNTKYRFAGLLMAFLTYYVYFSTEILRESIAILIFILNYQAFVKRQWRKYYLGLIFCIFFHLSSSFLIFLPLVRNLRFNKAFILVTMGFITLCIMLRPIFEIIDRVIPVLGDKAVSYGKHGNVGYLWAGLRVLQFTIIPFVVLWCSIYQFKIKPKYEEAYLYLILLGIGVIFVPIIFQRFTNYFYPLLSLSLADVLSLELLSKRYKKRVLSFALSVCITLSYGYYFVYLDFYQMWIPYYSIFNPKHYPIRYRFANGGQG